MSDKKGAPRNHWAQWTVDEITFVEQHYGQLSAREIGERLGRSANGGPGLFSFPVFPGVCCHPGRKGNSC
ncbi:Uncharacterised protein [Salmonella enterica]|nr:Uncharacterised protein [Salmonella enterica]